MGGLIFMQIVPATFRDLNALRKLERICFDKDIWPLFDLIAVLTFPDVVRLKGVLDRKMIGFVAGDPRPSRGFAWIATVAVHPEHQRKGYGRLLLQACEAQIKLPRVRLTVRMSNDRAISMYKQEGYQTYDIWKRYYDDGEDGLVMEKMLHPDAL